MQPMKRHVLGFLALAVLAGLAAAARADDKANATGKWKWKIMRQMQETEVTLTLKQEGDKLTGSMPGPNNSEIKIEDGTIKDGEVSFSVTRERNGQKFTQK